MRFVKAWLLMYAVVGSGYLGMYVSGNEVVERFAVGPLWLLMMFAPVVLFGLIFWPLIKRVLVGAKSDVSVDAAARSERILTRRRDLSL